MQPSTSHPAQRLVIRLWRPAPGGLSARGLQTPPTEQPPAGNATFQRLINELFNRFAGYHPQLLSESEQDQRLAENHVLLMRAMALSEAGSDRDGATTP